MTEMLLIHGAQIKLSTFSSTTSLTCKQVNRAEALLQFTQKYSEKTV